MNFKLLGFLILINIFCINAQQSNFKVIKSLSLKMMLKLIFFSKS